MHAKPNECPCLALIVNEVERIVILALLSGDHCLSRTELERELSASKDKPIDVVDAIENLYAAGLVNVSGELVSAARAARHMDELLGRPL